MAKNENLVMAKELRTRSDAELESLLASKSEELQKAQFKHALQQLRDTHTLGGLRRDIARLKTILSERTAVKEQVAS